MNLRKLNAAIELLHMPYGPVQISAAHLIHTLRADGEQLTMSPAMLSVGMHTKGERRFDAIGGGVAVTELGKSVVERDFQATDVAYDDHDMNHDARFVVPHASFAYAALQWLGDLEMGRRGNFEFNPHREVFGELSGNELAGIPSIVPPEYHDWQSVTYDYLGVSLQPPSEVGCDTSVNAGSIPKRRLFHLWQMNVSSDVLSMMRASEAIAFLSPADIRTTCAGKHGGIMGDGTPLANNLGLEIIVDA